VGRIESFRCRADLQVEAVESKKAAYGADVRSAALLVALFTIAVGILGLASLDSLTTVRRLYFATPVGLYAAAAVRVAMGLVVILAAPASRAPKTLRALGALVCVQGIGAVLFRTRSRASHPRMGGNPGNSAPAGSDARLTLYT
jgi:hypothetical protein